MSDTTKTLNAEQQDAVDQIHVRIDAMIEVVEQKRVGIDFDGIPAAKDRYILIKQLLNDQKWHEAEDQILEASRRMPYAWDDEKELEILYEHEDLLGDLHVVFCEAFDLQ